MKSSETAYSGTLLKISGKDYDLYDHQVKAIGHIDRGRNVVLSVPTAAGKTVVAYHAIAKALSQGGKAMYVVPLKALASEKFRELRRLREDGIRVGLLIGDYEVDTETLSRMQVLVSTSEKADSILRHDPGFFNDFRVMVIDETQLLGEEKRGPILEGFITASRIVNPDLQFVCLSATISNRQEIASWLNAEVVLSDFRPVPMRYGILNKQTIVYDDNEEESVEGDIVRHVVGKQCGEGGQVLIFRGSRKKAEDEAQLLSESFDFSSSKQQRGERDDEADRHEELLDSLMRKGIAFHHAGLSSNMREKIESGFRAGRIKVICATPSLASGVNLPARAVLVRDITRYSSGYSTYLPVSEVRQMLGRAGRPDFDRIGYGLIYASSPSGVSAAKDYIESDPEPIISKLGNEAKVRFCVLGAVSTGLVTNTASLESFFGQTLYASQNGADKLVEIGRDSLDFLIENDFVLEAGGRYRVTKFGEASSNLYIDPRTALTIREYLQSGEYGEERALMTASASEDMPKLTTYGSEILDYTGFLERNGYEDDPDFYSAAKTAMMLRDWISEKSVPVISEDYNVGHGDIQARATAAEWILYSMSRLAVLFRPEIAAEIDALALRVKDGVGSDILALTRLRGIGRVRGRRLYRAGYSSLQVIASATPEAISELPGFSKSLAEDVIAQARRVEGTWK